MGAYCLGLGDASVSCKQALLTKLDTATCRYWRLRDARTVNWMIYECFSHSKMAVATAPRTFTYVPRV